MDLKKLSQDIAIWRQNKNFRSERMPQEFWRQAVTLSKIHGPIEVAKAIRVQTSDLKKRINKSGAPIFHPGSGQKKKKFAKLIPPSTNDASKFEIEYNGITV